MKNEIVIRGARQNNLKNVSLTIPRDKLVVFTGLSGSGKSSLAFDTLYADGQRRYVESLSSYARQFLGQMEKPDVDSIEGLSPAISIDQKTTSKNPRSTVGTVTEIYDYLRLLYARIGIPHCPVCGRPIQQQTVDEIVDQVMTLPAGTRILVLAPVVRGRKGEHLKEFESMRRSGYARVRVDGSMYDLTETIKPDKNKKHTIEVVVDRLVIKEGIESRLQDALETVSGLTGGISAIHVMPAAVEGEEAADPYDLMFSQNYACPEHGFSMEELSPRMFSFNSPYGACPKCLGLGTFLKVDPDLVIPNRKLSIRQGAIAVSGWGNVSDPESISSMYLNALAKQFDFSLDVPVEQLPDTALKVILYGTKGMKIPIRRPSMHGGGVYKAAFEGVCTNVERRYADTMSPGVKEELRAFMSEEPCPECGGERLKKEILSVTVGGKNIMELCRMPVTRLMEFLHSLELSRKESIIGERILKEIGERLGFLQSVGLEYLTLARSSSTLSGGESQRIRLATQIGSSLVGVLYILDEPSIGLHQRDNHKLIATLKRLRDVGNTVIVVEHDEETMFAADHIVDIGPGAGIHGGNVVCQGTVEDIMNCPESVTGQYLSGRLRIPVPAVRRPGNGNWLSVRGARVNNLKNITASIPLGTMTVVTGVSGSGKSSLINEILYKHLAATLNGSRVRAGDCDGIDGVEYLDKVINIDQSPIGRTPRSNPATYTGLFTDIRELFSQTSDAKQRGYGPGRFSFNIKGGRCEACEGDGIVKIEMHFLPDVYVPCEVCKGKRYNRETLEVRYKGKNISDVLDMTIEEAAAFFESIPKLQRRLQTLCDVGLGYVKVGQPATTLSGGEAQRVKLATELSRRATGRTIYVLDEPTTGLHTADVHKLLEVLQKFVDGGNTVLVIEHNLDVIKCADYILDLGPDGGDRGGQLVAQGTPEQIAECPQSATGEYLKKVL